MKRLMSVKTTTLLPLALLSAALATPAYANYFHDRDANTRLNIGSAPNPMPQDLRSDYPRLSRSLDEQGAVILNISLTRQGTASGAVVESSSGFPRLDDAAVAYVMANWVHEPINSQEMPAAVQGVVTFQLR